MKKGRICFILIFALFGVIFVLLGCENPRGQDHTYNQTPPPPPQVNHPSLRVVNETPGWSDSTVITAVTLVGYEFRNIRIYPGSSQTFQLDRGMPGGYTNINVTVQVGPGNLIANRRSNTFNFVAGEMTTIRLREWRLE